MPRQKTRKPPPHFHYGNSGRKGGPHAKLKTQNSKLDSLPALEEAPACHDLRCSQIEKLQQGRSNIGKNAIF
jgi:hypothetical protein